MNKQQILLEVSWIKGVPILHCLRVASVANLKQARNPGKASTGIQESIMQTDTSISVTE